MKKVAFFSGFYLPFLGGIERYTYNISKKLVERGYEVLLVTSQHEDSLPSLEIVDGLKIYRLPIKNIWKSRYPFLKKNKTYHELIEKIKEENIDYFISNTRFQLPAILGAKMARDLGKEAIVIEHGTTYLTLNNRLLDFILHKIEKSLINRMKKLTSKFYGVSQEASNWLKEFGVDASGVLYNAVDCKDYEKFHRVSADSKILISYSGRLQAQFKGIETLLAAFTDISSKADDIELVIAGDGPIYQDLVQQYSYNKNIKFLGKVSHDEVMKLNNDSDIFVLLSKIEGFSTSMIEAAMMENVIITTDVGGARELIPDSRYGFIIENSKEALVQTLNEILNHKREAKEMQKLVSQRVLDNFTWDKTADTLENVFLHMEDNES